MTVVLRLAFAAVVLAIIGFGFYLTGSPSENRVLRRDELRVQDLSKIKRQIDNAFRSEEATTVSLEAVFEACKGESSYRCVQMQGINRDDFELIVDGSDSYQLCATFEREASLTRSTGRADTSPRNHGAGRHCYTHRIPKKRRPTKSSSSSSGN